MPGDVLFLSPVLVGKGRWVNIDAHSVPSQPQSIWIHSSLWRTNNLEETLITLSDSLPPFQTSSLPVRPPPPRFVFLSVVPLSPHLVKFPPSTPLSLSPPRYTLLAFHVCVPHHNRWIIDDHPWSRIPEIARCCYTHPRHGTTALSTGDIMIRPFNKCFYLKWTVICGVFLAETSRGFSLIVGIQGATHGLLCSRLGRCLRIVLSPLACRSICRAQKVSQWKDVLFPVIICWKINI